MSDVSVLGESMSGLNTVMWMCRKDVSTHTTGHSYAAIDRLHQLDHNVACGLDFKEYQVMQKTNSLNETIQIALDKIPLCQAIIEQMEDISWISWSYPVYAGQIWILLNIGMWPLEQVIVAISKVLLYVYLTVCTQGRLGDMIGVRGDDEGVDAIQYESALPIKRLQG
ncbi:hypothetical protein ARMSODRAFT_1026878 [Armillaria solidipes]|uniref:Uncharacterized protein n=1 Tax=Armillaria solidipes TaxID=1076256 RepID=A0A2H3AMM6_9AGAR|nr:hypothetical protein ARMSODRAFT_1026878 [Armillaria solidipes]